MVTSIPTGPVAGDRLVMVGELVTAGINSKIGPLTEIPFTTSATAPVVALFGTGTTILVLLQVDGVAEAPLKVTVLLPCVEPKPVPLIVTIVPLFPWKGAILPILALTVKL
jgi:hypothetical protein